MSSKTATTHIFSIRREKLVRRRERAWDRSFQPAGVRLTPKAWELAGILYGPAYGTLGPRPFFSSQKLYNMKVKQNGNNSHFFNQAWEIGPQALAGVRSKFSTRRCESWQVHKRDQGVEFRTSKNKASWWLESGLNMGPQYPSYKSSALTARLR